MEVGQLKHNVRYRYKQGLIDCIVMYNGRRWAADHTSHRQLAIKLRVD